eukprot:TRINITY_DN60739_c0_g1_i1.p1 TRINITY_DN60739_c0_g1~~TRINITY_DN60739_c0_g1_i1.p1  ORF type:complete len:415 (-),score=44.90 TRINITY_DN60739_c0_g1_i1:21-1238(-)
MIASASMLTDFETKEFINDLQPVPIENIGNRKWKQQRERLEQIAAQASYNLSNNTGNEFVSEHFISYEKLPVLVHELLVIETWKQKVYPLLKDKMQHASYMYLHFEQVLTNLLQFVLYNEAAVTNMGEELLELCDYCYRKIAWLNNRPDDEKIIKKLDPKEEIQLSNEEIERRQEIESEFKICITAVTIMWNIIKELPQLGMAIHNNLMIKNDVPLAFVALRCNEPWVKRGKKVIQKFTHGEWKEIKREDSQILTEIEGQIWTCLYVLLCDQDCRKKYKYDTHRKEEICKLRRYLNDTIIDQIPQLTSVARAIEELAMNVEPAATTEEAFRQSLMIEPQPELLFSISHGKDWKAIASEQESRLCSDEARREDLQRMVKLLDAFDFGEIDGAEVEEAAVNMKNFLP